MKPAILALCLTLTACEFSAGGYTFSACAEVTAPNASQTCQYTRDHPTDDYCAGCQHKEQPCTS